MIVFSCRLCSRSPPLISHTGQLLWRFRYQSSSSMNRSNLLQETTQKVATKSGADPQWYSCGLPTLDLYMPTPCSHNNVPPICFHPFSSDPPLFSYSDGYCCEGLTLRPYQIVIIIMNSTVTNTKSVFHQCITPLVVYYTPWDVLQKACWYMSMYCLSIEVWAESWVLKHFNVDNIWSWSFSQSCIIPFITSLCN